MRKCKCDICGQEFYENDMNPNIHYSSPSTICRQCETYKNTPYGGYFQLPNGEYIKKGGENDLY